MQFFHSSLRLFAFFLHSIQTNYKITNRRKLLLSLFIEVASYWNIALTLNYSIEVIFAALYNLTDNDQHIAGNVYKIKLRTIFVLSLNTIFDDPSFMAIANRHAINTTIIHFIWIFRVFFSFVKMCIEANRFCDIHHQIIINIRVNRNEIKKSFIKT